MATRLFLHAAGHVFGGTFPTAEQAAASSIQRIAGATSIALMNTTTGTTQTSITFTNFASSTVQTYLLKIFTSPPISGSATIGGGNMIINNAGSESNAAMNFFAGNTANIYVWRPSTGTLVGTIKDAANSSTLGLGNAEVGTGETAFHITSITTSPVAASSGDVIIYEMWARFTPGMATAYTGNVFWDGTTVNTTAGAAVTNHASFIEFTENFSFVEAAAAKARSFAVIC